LKEKRTAYFSRGGSWRAEYPLVWRKCELPMPTAEVMGHCETDAIDPSNMGLRPLAAVKTAA
jgi:hypothetical protein